MVFIWIIALLSIAGVIIRPFKTPEVLWALAGAVLLVLLQLLLPAEALAGILKGTDVYLFLTGMMLLAETAREEKLFDWLAAQATQFAKGSSGRLFLLIYLVGIVVTTFLSNDATAVVLTPAVAAAMKAAKVKEPLPYLLICAFIANAASFVLPISNPANLVLYGSHMPSLMHWLALYTLPSVVSIGITFLLLRFTQRRHLVQEIATEIIVPVLTTEGKTALAGIVLTAIVLLCSSAAGISLGMPTALTGTATALLVLLVAKKNPAAVLKGVSWSVLPLVAGLFVIVEALNKTGLAKQLALFLEQSALHHSEAGVAWGAGLTTAFGCNLMNNLPAGLVAGNVMQLAQVSEKVRSAVLIGIDLGPNLSVTGSLATILWLVALRREGIPIKSSSFLKLGLLVMTGALLCTLGALWL